jgi:hypothetical protein
MVSVRTYYIKTNSCDRVCQLVDTLELQLGGLWIRYLGVLVRFSMLYFLTNKKRHTDRHRSEYNSPSLYLLLKEGRTKNKYLVCNQSAITNDVSTLF